MVRFYDWPERLAAFIESRRFMPFVWGSNDCALFAADCRLELTGVDLAEGLRSYNTEAGATELIARAGGMVAFAATLTPRAVGLTQRGDTVLAAIDSRQTYGVCVGNGQWCAPGTTRLVFRPMSDVLKAFE